MKKLRICLSNFWLCLPMLILIVSGSPFSVNARSEFSNPVDRPEVTLDEDGLSLEWQASRPAWGVGRSNKPVLSIPGYENDAEAELPRASVLIALPPTGHPSLESTASGETDLSCSPEWKDIGKTGAVITQTVELEEVGILRRVRLARVSFYPVHRQGECWRFTPLLHVKVQFHAGFQPTVRQESQMGDPFIPVISQVVVNPSQIAPSPRALFDKEMAAINPQGIAVEVSKRGINSITYDDLAATGFPVGQIDPRLLRLIRAGMEIPMQWEGDGDAHFEQGERLLFFAGPRFSRWSTKDVYILSAEKNPGARMAARNASSLGLPDGYVQVSQVFEENNIYTPQCYCGHLPAGRDGDRWAWYDLRQPDRARASFPFNLPPLDPSRPGRLSLWLIGYTDVSGSPDHRVDVRVNGQSEGSVEWDGRRAITMTVDLPAGVLSAGLNNLEISLPGLQGVSIEGVWLDAFEIRYSPGSQPGTALDMEFTGQDTPHAYHLALPSMAGLHAYDITLPDAPIFLDVLEINGGQVSVGDVSGQASYRYLLTGAAGIQRPGLRRMENLSDFQNAQYVVISPPEFIPALAPLLALRRSQGLVVGVQTPQAIYDVYSGGRPDLLALRSYLSDAYHSWSTPPVYVLLVGDGTFDPKHYRSQSAGTYILTYLDDVDPWMGETAADNRYVAVDGSDPLPDMLIGRLPVNTLEETKTVVDKILRYEGISSLAGWKNKILFAAGPPDASDDFPDQSERLIRETLPGDVYTRRVFLDLSPASSGNARRDLLDGWNTGVGLVIYHGHSSIHQWAVERLFHTDDLGKLNNAPRLPVVLEMTCFTGSFHDPFTSTLDEALLRTPSGGAVAVWGPSGLGITMGHYDLGKGFLASLVQESGGSLGMAALSGKEKLLETGLALDLIDTYNLLGDPALRISINLPRVPLYLPSLERK